MSAGLQVGPSWPHMVASRGLPRGVAQPCPLEPFGVSTVAEYVI
jgi:hypothetical protein